MSDENQKSSSQQNIITTVLLVVVIVLLAANLFKSNTPHVIERVVEAEEDGSQRKTNDRAREEDPYIANQVKNTLLKGYVKIRDCYNNFVAEKPPVTNGIVTIDWTIEPDGDVRKAELVSSELGSEKFTSCLTAAIESFKFPPPPNGKPKYVAHKYRFTKDTEQK